MTSLDGEGTVRLKAEASVSSHDDAFAHGGGPQERKTFLLVVSLASFVVAALTYLLDGGQAAGFIAVCIAMAIAALVTLRWSRLSTHSWTGFATLVVTMLTSFSVGVPGFQLLLGQRQSVLSRLGVVNVDAARDVPVAFALAAISVAAFGLGESVLVQKNPRLDKPKKRFRLLLTEVYSGPSVFYLALLIGIAASLATPGRTQEALELRGQVQGQGVQVALADCLPVAISAGIVRSHWNSKVAALASIVGLAVLLGLTQSRSPVLLVAVALLVRLLTMPNRLKRIGRLVAAFVVIGYISLIFIVSFSAYRTEVLDKGSATFSTILAQAALDPLGQAASVGAVDTSDGLMLATRVDPQAVDAHVTDPALGFINLIPSQLLPEKTEFLGPKVSHLYTVFGGKAGLFLSGPGYLYIIWFGWIGVALGFLLLGLVAGRVALRVRAGAGLAFCLWIYFLCRFVIGGDAFDILYVLTMAVGFLLAGLPVLILTLLFRTGEKV